MKNLVLFIEEIKLQMKWLAVHKWYQLTEQKCLSRINSPSSNCHRDLTWTTGMSFRWCLVSRTVMRGKRDMGALFVWRSIKCYKNNAKVQNLSQGKKICKSILGDQMQDCKETWAAKIRWSIFRSYQSHCILFWHWGL